MCKGFVCKIIYTSCIQVKPWHVTIVYSQMSEAVDTAKDFMEIEYLYFNHS